MPLFSNSAMDANTADFLGKKLTGASLGRAKVNKRSTDFEDARKRKLLIAFLEKKLAKTDSNSKEWDEVYDNLQEARKDPSVRTLEFEQREALRTRRQAQELRARAKTLAPSS